MGSSSSKGSESKKVKNEPIPNTKGNEFTLIKNSNEDIQFSSDGEDNKKKINSEVAKKVNKDEEVIYQETKEEPPKQESEAKDSMGWIGEMWKPDKDMWNPDGY